MTMPPNVNLNEIQSLLYGVKQEPQNWPQNLTAQLENTKEDLILQQNEILNNPTWIMNNALSMNLINVSVIL